MNADHLKRAQHQCRILYSSFMNSYSTGKSEVLFYSIEGCVLLVPFDRAKPRPRIMCLNFESLKNYDTAL